jgi:AcrR family transcriptional regulator
MAPPDGAESERPRPQRRDAAANRERLLDAATVAIRREGLKVPMTTVAEDAGVGVGTLYRNFPDRADLLGALAERSYRLVLRHATAALAVDGTALDALAEFFDLTIVDRDALILPFHGGPLMLDAASERLRAEISGMLDKILRKGKRAGLIRRDVTAIDVIVAGAMLAQPLPHFPDWDLVARRQARLMLAGIAQVEDARLPGRGLTRARLEELQRRAQT